MKKAWLVALGLLSLLLGCGRTLPTQEESQFKSYSHEEQEVAWTRSFSRAQPSKPEMREYFIEAAKEFDVPSDLLMAIGQVETNWTQIGPGVDYGWGVMHLVENPYSV